MAGWAARAGATALLIAVALRQAFAADYSVAMTKVPDGALAQALQASSTLIELEKAPPDDVTALRRRAQEDLERLQKALRATGYYDGKVAIAIDGDPVTDARTAAPLADYDDDAKKKLPVKITVTPGPLYHLGRITLAGAESVAKRVKTALKPGAAARAADIIAERRRLLDAVMREGYPLAAVTLEPATVDHATHTVDVVFTVDPGPPATLGEVTVRGLDRVSPAFIAQRTAIKPGTPYSPAALDALRDDLQSLDVFSSVKVTPATALDADGRLPVTVDVTERERHFVGVGASYSTNDGAGATAYWGDRNLFGGGERLRLDADVSGFGGDALGGSGGSGGTSDADYSLSASFRKPDYWTRRQDFLSSLSLSDEHDPDTFDKRAVTATAGFERTLTKKLKVNFGWAIEKARIDDHTDTRNFLLDGPTGGIAYDTTNDLLNPVRGVRLTLNGEAYPTWLGSSEDVFTTNATASGYLNLVGKGDLVLAGRVAVGSVFGSSLDDLPADRRLYAGGGGSVRGYAFRSISPENADGDLTGGRSAITSTIELRYRFLEDYGLVPFFDAGTVSRHATPGFDEPIRYGAGLGFRYYTSFGPIRADIAVPLNPRHDDDPVAFYVSIGQSF